MRQRLDRYGGNVDNRHIVKCTLTARYLGALIRVVANAVRKVVEVETAERHIVIARRRVTQVTSWGLGRTGIELVLLPGKSAGKRNIPVTLGGWRQNHINISILRGSLCKPG